MWFVIFAAAVVIWSLTIFRWANRTLFVLLSLAVIAAAAVSLAIDVRDIHAARDATASSLTIDVVRRGDWWQLDYARDGVAFTTANELHVPAGTAVTLRWHDAPAPWIAHAVCLPRGAQCSLVANEPFAGRARFARVWPPLWRTLRVVADPPSRFESWFANEATPAHADPRGAEAFRTSGCTYCHAVRGAGDPPFMLAPDLTHFAARATIAGTDIPNHRGTLTGWVVHPRDLKPTAEMPDNRLAPGDLREVVAFLESLR